MAGWLLLGCSGGCAPPTDSDFDTAPFTDDGGTTPPPGSSDAGTAGAEPDLAGLMPPPDDPHANAMGINLQEVSYYAPDWLFADAVKSSAINPVSGSGTLATDADGWPAEDCQFLFFSDGVYGKAAGVYKLSFTGQATLGGSLAVSNVAYDAPSNTTTADLTYGGSGNAYLNFTGTKRTPSSASGSGVTNVRCMKPGSAPGDTFTQPIKDLIAKFSVIRFMDFTSTNWSQMVEWSDRTLPTRPSQQVSDPAYGWEGRGAAWEYAIQLANETGRDMWINIPIKASDDYIQKLALLIRDGGNGFQPLDPRLRVYVEYSNEVWNGGFSQCNDNHALAVAEVQAGGSPLDYDQIHDSGGWTYAWRRVAKRAAEISVIFRSVFGDAQMMTRIRPVLEWQQNAGQGTPMAQLTFLDGYYNNGDGQHVTTPHPPGWYFYGAGGSGYYNPDGTVDATTIWSSGTMSDAAFATVCQADVDWTLAYGLQRVAYEGGPSFDKGSQDNVKAAAWGDPKMKQALMDHHDTWSRNGGGLLVYFQSTGDQQWGFTHDVATLSTPKLAAIDALGLQPRAAPTWGTLVPAAIDASQPSASNRYGGHAYNLSPGDWYSYSIRVDHDAAFQVSASASAIAAGSLELIVDGNSLGLAPIAVSSSAQPTAMFPVTLAAGLHSVAIRGRGGALAVTTLHVD
jgi:hypothetical protein